MPQPVPGILPWSFSLTRIAHPSRGRLLPCSYPPACLDAPRVAVHLRFPRLPRLRAVAWFPRRLWVSFPRAVDHGAFPGRPGLRKAEPSTVPPASPTSKPCSPRETVLPTAGFPVTVSRFSRVCPFEAFSFHASDPRPARPRRTEHAPSPAGSGARPEGPVTPRAR